MAKAEKGWPRKPVVDLTAGRTLDESADDPAGIETQALADAKRRAARLATLNDASRELTALRSIAEVCETIYAQTRRVLDCTVFYMGLYAPERNEVDIMLVIDQGERYPTRSLPANESLLGQVIASREPLVRGTRQELLAAARFASQGQGGPQSAMFVPMLLGDRVAGIISAQSYKEHAYSGEDVQTLQSLANQAAVVIENARLFAEARDRIQQLEVVQRLGMELNRLDSVAAIAQSVARSIEALLPFDAYRIMLVEDAAQELVPVAFGATQPEYEGQSVDSLRMPVGEGIAGWSALTGDAQVVDNTAGHPHSLPVPGTPEIDESMLVAPMRRDQRVLGVLTLSKVGLRQYSSEHLRLLRIFADQAATAIANAQLYESARQQADKLKELDQLRTDFVSTIAHELRTPLTAILGYTETLLNFWERLDPERQHDMIRRTYQSTSRLDRLVKDLLAASRMDAGSLSLNVVPVELAGQVQQAATEISTKFGGQSIALQAPEEPLTVLADMHRVQQILVNLLDNAAKYSPEDSVITVSWRREGGFAVVSVADQGIGVAAADLPRLFTRFGKIAQVARQGHVGTGLGLYISRQLVEAMDGEIWVETAPGQGSAFSFRLPLAR